MFKLLHVFYCLAQLEAEILTLGTNNSRREIELIHEKFTPLYFARDCLFLNGILYWRSTSFDSSIDYFDFIEEKFDDVPPPEGRNFIHNPEATFWGKLVWYWSYFGNEFKTPYSLISSNEVNKVRMKVTSESVKLVLLEAENSDKPEFVLATASLISTPS
ncbi:hypothetical protein A4A49_16964 [Nicotiana attenuata]|uniref:F-box protein n=1 Tax=Nicotiana attenuata TaxID=49451 RepID=A0A314KKM8_NICAT|nr:hypothetical protein A4A49_16964 [Nicotiana attenuata]